jgi:hypothetical protein
MSIEHTDSNRSRAVRRCRPKQAIPLLPLLLVELLLVYALLRLLLDLRSSILLLLLLARVWAALLS